MLASPRHRAAFALVAGLCAFAGCGGSTEPDSARDAVDKWVAAINDRDFERACSLEDGPESDCATRREDDFGPVAGKVRATGGYQQGEERLFAVEYPQGTSGFSARRVGGEWRVHPEIQIIR